MVYVYVLYGADKKFYIGYTADLRRRVSEHQRGGVRSTNERSNMKLIFYEAFANEHDARRRERYLKSTKGRAALRIMLQAFLRTK